MIFGAAHGLLLKSGLKGTTNKKLSVEPKNHQNN